MAAEIKSLLDRSWTSRDLRDSWGSPQPSGRVRTALAAIGAPGLTVPETFGGAGGDDRDLVLVLEEYGRAAIPDSFAIEAGVAVPVLIAAGGRLADEWLPKIATGTKRAAVALGDGAHVLDADAADLILIAQPGGTVRALERNDVKLVAAPSIDGGRRLFRVAAADSGTTFAVPGLYETTRDRFRFVEAASLLGLSERMLGMAVAHALARQQFGQPIGAFQAVKHRLADAAVAIELARPCVYAAAWSCATHQKDLSRGVSIAKLFAGRAAAGAARHALQVHGGIGFAAEHDLHLYLKRAKALELASGGADAVLDELTVDLAL